MPEALAIDQQRGVFADEGRYSAVPDLYVIKNKVHKI
jgi:hypothetical protein